MKWKILLLTFCFLSATLCAQDSLKNVGNLKNEEMATAAPQQQNKKSLDQPKKKDRAKNKQSQGEGKTKTKQPKGEGKTKTKQPKGDKANVRRDSLRMLNSRIESLEAELSQCNGKTEAMLDAQMQSSQNELQKLRSRIAQDSATIDRLQSDLASLQGFRAMWVSSLVESVDSYWLAMPYSQIVPDKMQELTSLTHLCRQYAPTDGKIKKALSSLQALEAECIIYQKGDSLINSQYDKGMVNNSAASVASLRDRTKDDAKREELDSIYKILNDYGAALSAFKRVVRAVDAITDGKTNPKGTFIEVEAELKRQEEDYERISAIEEVPWLRRQYNEYYKALKKNCLGKNTARDLIISLQP